MNSDFDSLRKEEQHYEQQIRQTYKEYPHLFVTHSSDLLNLDVVSKTVQSVTYKAIVAKSPFTKFDVIAQVRGSIISFKKLLRIVEEGKVECQKLPVLLYLNFEQQCLLSPKNITKYLFTHPFMAQGKQQKRGNCYIQNHFGSKLLAIASRNIQKGQQIILEQQSYQKIIYKFNPAQF